MGAEAKMQGSFIRLKLLAVLLLICSAAGFSSTLPAEDALDPLNVRGGKGGADHRHAPDINSGREGRAATGGWTLEQWRFPSWSDYDLAIECSGSDCGDAP